MFGIWVFTFQGAHGSLVLKSGSSMQRGRDPVGLARTVTSGLPTDRSHALKHPHPSPCSPSPGSPFMPDLPMGAGGWVCPGQHYLRRQVRKPAFAERFLCPCSGLGLSFPYKPVQQASVPSWYRRTIKAQRGLVTCPGAHSQSIAALLGYPGHLDPQSPCCQPCPL